MTEGRKKYKKLSTSEKEKAVDLYFTESGITLKKLAQKNHALQSGGADSHTKKDIIRYTNCHPKKIIVTYEAANKRYQPIKDRVLLQKVQQKYDLPENFILYVGSLSPRKNINRLLKAFCGIHKKIPHYLVLTGSKSWKDSSVRRTIRRLNLNTHNISPIPYQGN